MVFRLEDVKTSASPNDWQSLLWNNRDTLIEGKQFFLEKFLSFSAVYLTDLLLNCSNIDSFEIAARNIEKSANFLIRVGQPSGLHSISPEEQYNKYILILYYTIFLH